MFDILGYTNYNTFSDKFHIIQTESFVFIANCVFFIHTQHSFEIILKVLCIMKLKLF